MFDVRVLYIVYTRFKQTITIIHVFLTIRNSHVNARTEQIVIKAVYLFVLYGLVQNTVNVPFSSLAPAFLGSGIRRDVIS